MIIDIHGHLGNINSHPRWAADAARLEALRREADFDYLTLSSARSIMYDVHAGNHEILQAVQNNPRFLGYMVVNPLFPDTLKDLDHVEADERIVGVKLHPDYHGIDVRSSRYRDCIARVLEKTDLVLFHCSCMQGTGFASIDSLLDVAAQYPDKRFIVAHMAGIFQNGLYPYFPNLSGVESVARSGLANVWIDTAHYLMYCYPEVMEEALSYCEPERFVFGTDVPLQGSRQMSYAADTIKALDIPEPDRDKIFFGNAIKILGEKAPPLPRS